VRTLKASLFGLLPKAVEPRAQARQLRHISSAAKGRLLDAGLGATFSASSQVFPSYGRILLFDLEDRAATQLKEKEK